MAKKIKLNIKNDQLAEALNLGDLKDKLAKRAEPKETKPKSAPKKKTPAAKKTAASKKTAAKSTAKSTARTTSKTAKKASEENEIEKAPEVQDVEDTQPRVKARSKSAFAPDQKEEVKQEPAPEEEVEEPVETIQVEEPESEPEPVEPVVEETPAPKEPPAPKPVKLGPTGRHIDDILKPAEKETDKEAEGKSKDEKSKDKAKGKPLQSDNEKGGKGAKVKQYRDFKPRHERPRSFDARDRQGLRDNDDDQRWRKRRQPKQKKQYSEDLTIRPTSLKVRVPITVKDLAAEMKYKASEVIAKLLSHGVILTLNDAIDDEVTLHLIGEDLGCQITIDTSEEERIRITDKTIREEVNEADPEKLKLRPSIVAFMGHVDHGKTSLIDAIRKSNRVSGEAGAITQHIGAFRCHTKVGDITVLDTPGHEAFSAMRARGADVTDIVVLVVAGDEGIKQQTVEAIQHAKAAGVTIVVAVNKCDKPGFNIENIYRELSEQELLPEAWGGQTITVNTSAVTGEGIDQLLEMLALQAEILELRADPSNRARGSVLESEMHKGLGMVATILVQNGTLKQGDALICDTHWGRVKTMHDEHGKNVKEAAPSTPVEITGLSSLPEAGEEFIVVSSEKEAREIAEARALEMGTTSTLRRRPTLESLLQDAETGEKKILNVILRADVQGSLEALKVALQKIESDKADLQIIASGVGEVSESDVQLAAASKAIIVGFHTQVESNAADMAKEKGVTINVHDIIYHAIDNVKALMAGLLDKVAKETDMGTAEVKATFKSSQHGIIAGCLVSDGIIHRNHHMRVIRDGDVIATTGIQSLKRVQEDVREVKAGVECGILLTDFKDVQEGDVLQAFEITYISQEL